MRMIRPVVLMHVLLVLGVYLPSEIFSMTASTLS